MFDKVGIRGTGEGGHGETKRKRSHGEELVIEEFLDSGSVPGVALEHFRYKAFTVVGNRSVFWIGVVAIFNLGVSGFDVASFKGRPAHSQGIRDDSQTPDVDLERVAVDVYC